MFFLCGMVALHDLHWNFIFSSQMICKQYIVLNHMFSNPLQKQESIPVGSPEVNVASVSFMSIRTHQLISQQFVVATF